MAILTIINKTIRPEPRPFMALVVTFLVVSGMTMSLIGCGKNPNLFQDSSRKKDKLEEATSQIAAGQDTDAIELLSGLTGDEAYDQKAVRSLMATAYLDRAKIDIMTIGVKIAEVSALKDPRPFFLIFNVLPDPTPARLGDIREAIALLATNEAAGRTQIDDLKLAVAILSYLGLELKALDVHRTYRVSKAELMAMSRTEAQSVADTIVGVATTLANNKIKDIETKNAALIASVTAKVTEVKSGMDNSTGGTDGERLKSYLAGYAPPGCIRAKQ